MIFFAHITGVRIVVVVSEYLRGSEPRTRSQARLLVF